MTRVERCLQDQSVRDRVVADLGTTFLLEASAGTGKTSVLVERYVACVLDAERGAGDCRRVAAITFTEKAAGELRQRIRERFEQLAGAAEPGSARAMTVEAALEALDDAPISTIHSFAARLLREHAVEAGVDPAFEQLDQLSGELELDRLWEAWLTELAAGGPQHERPRAWLKRLLQIGVSLDQLRELAVCGLFAERYDSDPAPEPPPPPDIAAGVVGLLGPALRLREHCQRACIDPTDGGYLQALELVEALEACGRAAESRLCDGDSLSALLFGFPVKTGKNGPGGRQGSWRCGREDKDEFLRRYACVADGVSGLRDAFAAHVTGLAVAVGDAFTRWAGAAQLAAGRLDFTDLLGQLRDLLVRDRAMRRCLQRRFAYILVDEFQDTDPLQAESVFLLCEHEPLASSWREVRLEPGKLFIVGDPKQSIYRFRRADIALYDEAKALVAGQPDGAGEVLAITQNFRTSPALIDWINTVFASVFGENSGEGRQPGYQSVVPFRPQVDGGPPVAVLLGRRYGREAGESDAARRDEARALASLLRQIHDDASGAWAVCQRSRSGAGRETRRPASWGDVAILMRSTTSLATYEEALREAGIPYRVEGGKTYFGRREIADALLCLRAVNDPTDGPAVYGALHSCLFGFSDDELVRFWGAGGRFDVFFEAQPEGESSVKEALALLRTLHERRGELAIHDLLEELLRATHALELFAAAGEGAVQAMANLEGLVERARAFAAAGGGGLGAFIAWAAKAGDAGGEQESQAGDEADVVHVLTIHRAKGLEYPIVVLAGGALGGRAGGEATKLLVDRRSRRVAVKLKVDLPGATETLLPAAFAELKEYEQQMEASEARRLLYVALTRARDRLVISCFGSLRNADGKPSAALLGPLAEHLPEPGATTAPGGQAGLVVVLTPTAPPERARRPLTADAASLLTARTAWVRGRERLFEEATRPAFATSPSALELVDDVVRSGGPGAPPGRAGALALGSAVHRAMELCDLNDPGSPARLAVAACAELGRPDLAERAAALAAACWRAAPVRAAARSPETYRELPVGAVVDGVIVSGAVDLLYRDGAEWIVVDYKTDRCADAETLRERYALQGAAYALIVEAAVGGVVREVAFVAAAANLVIVMPVTDELRRRARADVSRGGAAFRVGATDIVE